MIEPINKGDELCHKTRTQTCTHICACIYVYICFDMVQGQMTVINNLLL